MSHHAILPCDLPIGLACPKRAGGVTNGSHNELGDTAMVISARSLFFQHIVTGQLLNEWS